MNHTFRTVPWTAPRLEQLEFATNCTLVGQFASTWYTRENGVNDQILAAYFLNALPDDLKENRTVGQMLDWYYRALRYAIHRPTEENGVFLENVLTGPSHKCRKEFCAGVPWSGIPDILGIGVLYSYYIGAGLVTLFGFVTIYHYVQSKQLSLRAHGNLSDTIRGSLSVLLDSATYFSLAICIASLANAVQPSAEGGQFTPRLEHHAGNIVALFSFSCVVCLHILSRLATGRPNREVSHWGLFAVLSILTVVQFVVASRKSSDRKLTYWEVYCEQSQFSERISQGILAFYVILVVFGVLHMMRLVPQWEQLLGRWLKWITLGSCFVVLWSSLILTTVVRQSMIDLSGQENQDSHWTFGQFLAIWAWLPVIIEALYVYIFGLEKAMQGRILSPYKVVLLEAQDEPTSEDVTKLLGQEVELTTP